MTEVDKEGVVNQEPATPVETTENQPSAVSESTKSDVGTKEYNWRKMEQKLQELESKNQELEKTFKERSTLAKAEEADEFAEFQSDDLLTYGQAQKLSEKRKKESDDRAKQIIAEELAKREREELPAKVKKQYEDYDQVVTNENIEKLVQERPAWENTIKNDANPFEAAYCLIKQSSFYKGKIENKQTEERIADNSQKPVSSNTIGAQKGPLSQANAFATQSKADLWAEMKNYSKKAGTAPEMR